MVHHACGRDYSTAAALHAGGTMVLRVAGTSVLHVRDNGAACVWDYIACGRDYACDAINEFGAMCVCCGCVLQGLYVK